MHLTHLTRHPDMAFGLPLDTIMLLEEAPDAAPCETAIFYDTGNGPTPVQLDDNYGHVAKLLTDAGIVANRQMIELHQAVEGKKARLLISHPSLVVMAEQEVDDNGGQTTITARIGGQRNVTYVVTESFQEIQDLIDPPKEPKPRRKRKGSTK